MPTDTTQPETAAGPATSPLMSPPLPASLAVDRPTFGLILSDATLTALPGDGERKDGAGQTIHLQRMRIGKWGVHAHRGTGEPIEVSRDRAEAWKRNVAAQSAVGRRPFLTFSHTVEPNGAGGLRTVDPDARDTAGYITDVVLADDGVYVDTEIHGDQNLAVAARNSRSLCAVPLWWGEDRDNAGNKYDGETLHHVAMVPNPVLEGLGGMVSIAASDGVKLYEHGRPEPKPSGPNPYRDRAAVLANPFRRRADLLTH